MSELSSIAMFLWLLISIAVSVEGILQAVERKQAAERDMLLQLLQAVQDDEALKTKVESQTPQVNKRVFLKFLILSVFKYALTLNFQSVPLAISLQM